MAYSSHLADSIRDLLAERAGFDEKRMFGGVCFLANGNMACGVSGDDIIVRVGANDYDSALREDGVSEFQPNKRGPMRGWVTVAGDVCERDDELRRWVEKGWAFAADLPPKV